MRPSPASDWTAVQSAHIQGCSLGLEHLGLEAVSRRFLERLGLVSFLKVERLVSVLRVSKKWNVSVSLVLES